MLTLSTEEEVVTDAIIAGACGFLLKDAEGDQILAAIAAAAAGESPLSPRIASALIQRVRERERPPASDRGDRPTLTTRERQVLSLIVEGKDNNEIAAELVISPETVKTHVSTILEKLQVDNRVQAAVEAVRAGSSERGAQDPGFDSVTRSRSAVPLPSARRAAAARTRARGLRSRCASGRRAGAGSPPRSG
jgi:DNA-binding NarL/FixJ family response regulator